MKKLLLIILMLALFLNLVEAKNINITKTDFYKENRQAYRLEQGDGISFLKDNKEYIISLDEIGKNSIRLKSFGYKNGSRETFYILLNQKYSNKIDFEKDDIDDMQVNLLKIWDNKSKVDVLFETLKEENSKQENKEEIKNVSNELRNGLIITASTIIIGLIIFFILRKKK